MYKYFLLAIAILSLKYYPVTLAIHTMHCFQLQFFIMSLVQILSGTNVTRYDNRCRWSQVQLANSMETTQRNVRLDHRNRDFSKANNSNDDE